jgi:hypothetical protein
MPVCSHCPSPIPFKRLIFASATDTCSACGRALSRRVNYVWRGFVILSLAALAWCIWKLWGDSLEARGLLGGTMLGVSGAAAALYLHTWLKKRKRAPAPAETEPAPEKTPVSPAGAETQLQQLLALLQYERDSFPDDARSLARQELLQNAIRLRQGHLQEAANDKFLRRFRAWKGRTETFAFEARNRLGHISLATSLNRLEQLATEGNALAAASEGLPGAEASHQAIVLVQQLASLQNLKQTLLDQQVLDAVGSAALPVPGFLAARGGLTPKDCLDDTEQDWLTEDHHRIKGQLRVIRDSSF